MRFRIRWRRAYPFLRSSRYLFLTLGLLAWAYCGFVLLETWFYQAQQSQRFQQALKDPRPPAGGHENLDPSPLPSSQVDADSAPTPMVGSTGEGFPLGRIEITRLGLSAMIQEGTDERTLQRAVGHFSGTPLPGRQGNVALAGHRDTFFRALRDVRVDDEIRLTTLDGSFLYRVSTTKVVSPEDIYVLAASDDAILTLVTCYPFQFLGPAPKRFIVRANRISG